MNLHNLLQTPNRLVIAGHWATTLFVPIIALLSIGSILPIDYFVFAVFFLSSSALLLFCMLGQKRYLMNLWKAVLAIDLLSVFALTYVHHDLQSDFYYLFIWCIVEAAILFSWRAGLFFMLLSAFSYTVTLLVFPLSAPFGSTLLRIIIFFISVLPVLYASYMVEVWKYSNDHKEQLLQEKERLLREKDQLVHELEIITQQMTDYTFDIQNLAVMDRLTQLFNQTYYHNRLMVEIEKSRSSCTPLSIVLFDIDNFKRFNDTFGHACGDEVLKIVSSAILSIFKDKYGFVARIGGEEMVVVMPETDTDDAFALAVEICKHISTLTYSFHGNINHNMKITVSGGVATFPKMADDATSLTKCADIAMYESKAQGKNRIMRYDLLNADTLSSSI